MDKLTEDIMVGTSMGKVDDKMMLGTDWKSRVKDKDDLKARINISPVLDT